MKQVSLIILMVCLGAFAQANSMYGVLMVVKGSVKIQNAAKKVTDGKVGGRVVEGDTITTGPDSRAKVVMSDRNVLNVAPDTVLVIAKYENDAGSGKKNVEMNLLQGKVRNNVEQTYDGEKNKFLIKTPTAVAGVRGTQFLAGFDVKTQMTSVVTFKGAVSFASMNAQGMQIGNPVTILKGFGTQASANAAPEKPKAVPKDELKKIDGDSAAAGAPGQNKRDVASGDTAPMVDAKDTDPNMAKEVKVVRPTLDLPSPPIPRATPGPTPPPIPPNHGPARVNVIPVKPQ